METYEALIFDLGKVVFDLSFDRVFQFWASASGQQAEAIKDNFQFDSFFDDFERGEISNKDFRVEISRRLNLKLTDQAFDEGWCALYLDAYEGIEELLGSLKKQYRLVALTNTNSIHEQVWKTKYRESLGYFDKVFCSHELKTRKPEKQAYQRVLDYLGVEPQQIIFLDDSYTNTEGAAQLGIKTILVESPQQMLTDLRKVLFVK
ncbi:MAG: HAD family phosphatase [Hymenobacter sp.]|nr:MAG: HAD family phosphatase [Hymenobacter sp.]